MKLGVVGGGAWGTALAQGAGAPAADIARFAWPLVAAQYRSFIAGLMGAHR